MSAGSQRALARIRLALNLARRETRGRFAGSHLGVLWAFFVPLLTSLVFVVIFSILMSGSMTGVYTGLNFTTLYFLGFAPWLLYSDVAARATGVIRENRALIRNMQFDHRLLPISMTGSAVVAHGVVTLLAMVLVVAYGHRISPHLWALPVYFALLMVFTIGWAYLLSALSVYLTDLNYVVPIVLNLLFFTAPILYTPELVTRGGSPLARFLLLELNPITRFVEGYRRSIVDVGLPFDAANLFWCAVWAAGSLAAGLWTYRKLEKGFNDVL